MQVQENIIITSRKNLRSGIIIFLCAFLIKLLIVFVTNNYKNIVLWEYDVVAKNILSGKGFTYEYLGTTYYSYLQPLYPILCALLYKITKFNYLLVLIFQFMISAGLCTLIFFISKRIFEETVAIIAAMLVMFHPGLLIYSTKTLHPLTLDSFFFALVIIVLYNLRDSCNSKNQLASGIVLGLSILTRATIIFFIPLAILWFLLNAGGKKKKKLLSLVFAILISITIIIPWTIRNYLHYKKFTFIVTNSWELLWRGNNHYASGTLWYNGAKTYLDAVPEEVKGKLEGVQINWFRQEVMKFWRQNPVMALKLYVKKIYYFWWFSKFSGKEYPTSWFRIYKIYYSFILASFLYALFKIFWFSGYRNLRYQVLLIIMLLGSICLGQSLFYVEGRHRLEIEALMLILSSFCLVDLTKLLLKYKKNHQVSIQ